MIMFWNIAIGRNCCKYRFKKKKLTAAVVRTRAQSDTCPTSSARACTARALLYVDEPDDPVQVKAVNFNMISFTVMDLKKQSLLQAAAGLTARMRGNMHRPTSASRFYYPLLKTVRTNSSPRQQPTGRPKGKPGQKKGPGEAA